jgi:hypothetical protein
MSTAINLENAWAALTGSASSAMMNEASQPAAATNAPGEIVERDGSNPGPVPPSENAPSPGAAAPAIALPSPAELGPNNERLEELAPRIVNALRGLVTQYREEGLTARRYEIRRIRQARLFWQGMQYAWWNPGDQQWHLPTEVGSHSGQSEEDMPRYQFVTNLYQAFGLSFISVLSQDVPTTRFYPQSAQSLLDLSAARMASEVADLVERNNHVERMLTALAFFLWTDGKVGGYVRYVADAQRFGWHDEPNIEPIEIALGADYYVCPQCGTETPAPAAADSNQAASAAGNQNTGAAPFGVKGAGFDSSSPRSSAPSASLRHLSHSKDNAEAQSSQRLAETEPACSACGAALTPDDLRTAEKVCVPRVVGTRRVPNGQEVISIVGGLELNTPVWANEMHEFPYLQWQMEVHRAKLKAAYPHAADKIEMGGPAESDDIYARASRVSIAQGMPTTLPGDALINLVTFARTWIRPWAFHAIEDAAVREALLQLFPDGCYAAFAGDTYCESRSETMDDRWRVLHALPGDGQNRPAVGSSLVEIQERYNTLSNIQAETYEYGIPPIYADPQVIDFDALQQQTAEPAAHYPARARPGQPLAASFFQPAPAQVPPDMLRHQEELMGPIPQFLSGLFPAVFGGEMESQKTATGYAMARDQALGRLGLVWRRLKNFYSDVMLLGVDCFRKNRPDDVEIPLLGEDGVFRSRWIRLADLKGNIFAHPESDEAFPRQKSQQRAVIQQLMSVNDPLVQRALTDPANIGYIKSCLGLSELVVPGEDARVKQMREIQQLLTSAPLIVPVRTKLPPQPGARTESTPASSPNRNPDAALPSPAAIAGAGDGAEIAGEIILPSIPVDTLLDDHATELEEIRRWASTETGQAARMENPLGFANVRAHAAAHERALVQQQEVAAAANAAAAPAATRATKAR